MSDLLDSYRPGDEDAILDLMWTVFNVRKNRDLWNWQFTAHPQGTPWITLARSGGELVGHYATIRYDLNYKGRQVTAGESVDLMVRADQRGKKWFTRLASENFASARRDGLNAVIGFPNRNSYPNFVRNLGWSLLVTLNCYTARTSFKKLLGPADLLPGYLRRAWSSTVCAALKKLARRNLVLETHATIPEGVEECLRQCRDYEVLSMWKDVPYLTWRYVNHPMNRYRFHTLKVDDTVEAFAVTRDCGDFTALCELFHRNREIRETSLLLRYLTQGALAARKSKLVFYGFDNGFFDAVFAAAGFSNIPTSSFVLCGEAFGDTPLARDFRLAQNWSVSYGDMDVI